MESRHFLPQETDRSTNDETLGHDSAPIAVDETAFAFRSVSLRLAGMGLGLAFSVAAASAASADETGVASYYHNPRFGGMTAAHRTLPLGSRVRVTNLVNGRAIIVTIVDRGPFIRGRVIDVSTAAAERLGFRRSGVVRVRLETI